MVTGLLDICRRRKLFAILMAVCLTGVVWTVGRRSYTASVEDTKRQGQSIRPTAPEKSPLPLNQASIALETHQSVQAVDVASKDLGQYPNRRPSNTVPEIDNDKYNEENVVETQEKKTHITDKTPGQDVVEVLAEDLVQQLGKHHSVLKVSKKLGDPQLQKVVSKLLGNKVNKTGSGVASVSSNKAHNLYVPSSMPLGKVLQLKHNDRQVAVVDAIKHAWKGYKQFAWGSDVLLPITMSGSKGQFGLGMTIIDCLDTLWLAGLQDEFDIAKEWVEHSLNIGSNAKTVSLFETNIRVLGGLLSAYHLSQEKVFLDKASELAQHLLPAFNTTSGVPTSYVNLMNGIKMKDERPRPLTIAEAGSLQLEFREVSHATGDPVFRKACDRDMDVLLDQAKESLVPMMVNPNTGKLRPGLLSVGAGIDSYYEYLIKQWVQSGKTEVKLLNTYLKSVQGVSDYLVGYTSHSKLPFVGIGRATSRFPPSPLMDHLSCFYPGMLALGLLNGLHPDQQLLAQGLTHTCYHMYEAMPTGIAPEIFHLIVTKGAKEDISRTGVPSQDFSNILRPETVESLFVLYRLTKDNMYREWGWKIFLAFEKYTKVPTGGYAGLYSVLRTDTEHNRQNKMESFFVAETLKYLFLLFTDDDNVLSLNEWVFNTEAHPLRIWNVPSSPLDSFFSTSN